MKTCFRIAGFSLLVCLFLFTACFNPSDGEDGEGTLTVRIGGGSERSLYWPYLSSDYTAFNHIIIVKDSTGNVQKEENVVYGSTTRFTVTGSCDISVYAYNPAVVTELKAVGFATGRPGSAPIMVSMRLPLSVIKEQTPARTNVPYPVLTVMKDTTTGAADDAFIVSATSPDPAYFFERWGVSDMYVCPSVPGLTDPLAPGGFSLTIDKDTNGYAVFNGTGIPNAPKNVTNLTELNYSWVQCNMLLSQVHH